VFYINYLLLLPKLLEQRQYVLYFVSIVAVIIVALTILYYIDRYLFPIEIRSMIKRGFPGDIPDEQQQREILGMTRREGPRGAGMAKKAMIFNGFHVLFVLFISTIYRNLMVGRKRDREALQLKNQVLEAESKMLKWQVNPHFLFNTLNNIYSMSQLKHDKTPDAIHRLSNMLRYVLYDCNEKDVSLEQELSYLKSYIELQLLKDNNIDNVTYDFEGANPKMRVAPLLFIAFVENSFKHSHIEDTDHSWIRIMLKTDGNRIIFGCENSLPDSQNTKDTTPGIGLENVKRRLELLYPKRHQLVIEEKKEIYSVTLILESDED
ncbi:MAG: histidine kinase, partial [Bacteroidales bacterium]|nr:histidine kinase [Bacteroidales bacterium]